ncbi:hypothetical protein [uncultured Ruminococcus sp.]|uniref:hypothetical protein n=1 Tax=uncultured Ruminococcus sp. TaxID=165186 RepID=UPI002598D63B|nr:hypothetical protein [uncultured Ruminococcus sp.]
MAVGNQRCFFSGGVPCIFRFAGRCPMISLFSHVISALLSKLFDKWTNKYIDRENEENSYRKCVRVSKAFSIAGGIWFICFAAFGVLSIVIWADGMTDWDSFACGVLFLLSSLSGIFCMLFRRNYRIFYTDTFVEKHGIFREKAGLPLGRTDFDSTKRCCLHIDFSQRKTSHCFRQGVCWQ